MPIDQDYPNKLIQKPPTFTPRISTDTVDSRPASKSVSFSDDKGGRLYSTRFIESSAFPPILDVERVTARLKLPYSAWKLTKHWILDGNAPISNYSDFVVRLSRDHICLETISFDGRQAVGTFKTDLKSFESATSFIRITYDNWISFHDIEAFRVIGVRNSWVFHLDLPLAPDVSVCYFCICCHDQEIELWDNNEGYNYTVSCLPPAVNIEPSIKETGSQETLRDQIPSLDGQYNISENNALKILPPRGILKHSLNWHLQEFVQDVCLNPLPIFDTDKLNQCVSSELSTSLRNQSLRRSSFSCPKFLNRQ